jgi:hypothetical protein
MIERVIQLVADNSYPSSGESLITFSTQAQHYLSQSGVLADLEIRQTDDPLCLLAIQAKVTSRAHTLQEVSMTLRQAWSALAYAQLEAASCERYEDGTVLRFVTATKQGGGLFVSGEVIAQGGAYAGLVGRFEHEFGDMHGGLVPMPRQVR